MCDGKQWIGKALFVIALGYVAIGVFPFAPMESDGNHIANGVTQMLLGESPKNTFSYRYEAQSGTYWMTYWLSKISGMKPLMSFGVLSAISALVFLLSASFSLAQFTKGDFALIGLMLLTFQESWTNAYYPNSNILAAAFLFSGFLMSIRSRKPTSLIFAGLLLGLGVWMRFDALLIFPALPLLSHHNSWRETGYKSFLIGIWAGITILAALYLSDVSLREILLSSQRHFQLRAATTPGLGIPWLGNSNVKSHLAYFSLFNLALLGLSLIFLLSSHQWKIIGIFGLGVLPVYLTYLGDLTTPKYLLYVTPFFSLLAVKGWRNILELPFKARIVWIGLLGLLFVGQYGLGLRLRFQSKPYYYAADPTFAHLLRTQIPLKSVDELSLVIGAGARISTVDRDRLFSGILYAPLMWRTQKTSLNSALHQLAERIDQSQQIPVYVLVDEDDPLQQVLIFLFDREYRCEQISLRERTVYPCRREGDGHKVVLMDIQENVTRRPEIFAENLAAANVQHFFFVVTAPWQEHLIDQHFLNDPNWEVKKLNILVYEFGF